MTDENNNNNLDSLTFSRFKIYDEGTFYEFDGFSPNELEAVKAYRNIQIPETDEDVDLIWRINAKIANALDWVNTQLSKLEAIKHEVEFICGLTRCREH